MKQSENLISWNLIKIGIVTGKHKGIGWLRNNAYLRIEIWRAVLGVVLLPEIMEILGGQTVTCLGHMKKTRAAQQLKIKFCKV